MCAFQLDIYKIVYRVIEIAEECSVNRSLLTFPQAPGGPHAVVATRVQNLQEMLQVCRLVMVCRWEMAWVKTEYTYRQTGEILTLRNNDSAAKKFSFPNVLV